MPTAFDRGVPRADKHPLVNLPDFRRVRPPAAQTQQQTVDLWTPFVNNFLLQIIKNLTGTDLNQIKEDYDAFWRGVIEYNLNVLVNPLLETEAALEDLEDWSWDDTVRHVSTGGSATVMGDGQLHEVGSEPILPVAPGQNINAWTWVRWRDIECDGPAFQLVLYRYDATNKADAVRLGEEILESFDDPNEDSAEFFNNDFIKLDGNYTIDVDDTQTKGVRLVWRQTENVTAGQSWWHDASMTKANDDFTRKLQNIDLDGQFDLTKVFNQLPNSQVEPAPAAGGFDLAESWQAMWTALTSAFSLSTGVDSTLAATSEAAQTVAQQAVAAYLLAVENANTLGVRNNRPSYVGMDNTTECGAVMVADIEVSSPLGSLSPANTAIAFVRSTRDTSFGSMSFYCNKTVSLTALYMVLYKLDFTTNTLVHHHTSADIKSLVSTTTNAWTQYNFASDQLQVSAGDVVAVEWHAVGANNAFILHGKASGITQHPTALLSSFGGFRSSPGTSPTTADLDYPFDFSWSQFWPHVGLEVTDLPAVFHPPLTTPYDTFGSHTHPIADWLQPGDFIDLIGDGGGGGGQGAGVFANGEGGLAGDWNATTLIVGEDIHEDATSISIDVGEGGNGGAPLANGGNGEATIFGWVDPDGNPQTLVCPAGVGGPLGPFWNIQPGEGAGDYYYHDTTYYGGGAQGVGGSPGIAPGGGGPGGGVGFGGNGSPGARGQAWIVERQT